MTATFEGGQTLTGTVFGDGSKGGGQVALVSAPASAPSLGVQGSTATALPSLSPVHRKVDVTNSTINVQLTGTPNAVVRLMKAPALMQGGVFDVEPYEANTVTDAVFSQVTLSASGTAVTLVAVPEGLTYLIAVQGSAIPSSGLASTVLIIKRESPSSNGVLYRVNVGGPAVAAGDGGTAWSNDSLGTPSPYLIGAGTPIATTNAIDLSDPSVPPAAVEDLFQTHRYDALGGEDMAFGFPVGSGQSYQVDLYFAETFVAAAGARIFDVSVEGVMLNDLDIYAVVGANAGYVVTLETPDITDDELTIQFTRQVQNPMINAIEVRNSTGA